MVVSHLQTSLKILVGWHSEQRPSALVMMPAEKSSSKRIRRERIQNDSISINKHGDISAYSGWVNTGVTYFFNRLHRVFTAHFTRHQGSSPLYK